MSAQIECDNCHSNLDCGESTYCLDCRDKLYSKIADLKAEIKDLEFKLKTAEKK